MAEQPHRSATEDELASWREILAEQPTGWDFSDLEGIRHPETPWSYETIVRNLVVTAHRVLDLGTGGGELLATLADVLPEGTVATEGWAPNVPLARDRLARLGIEVVQYHCEEGARLPFEDDSVDLILCRHDSFDAADVARVLAPRGAFLTLQVGGDDLQEIPAAFGIEPPYPENTLMNAQNALVRAGLTVERADVVHDRYEFADMTTLLRFLRRVPWMAPEGLDADRHREGLERLAAEFEDGPFTATATRFVILARKPGEVDEGRTDFSSLPTDDLEVPQV